MPQLLTDESAAIARLERHRRELHVHCYRMLGSFDDADDLVRETLKRAWHQRERLDTGPWLRAWLYRIATNACLEAIEQSSRRAPSSSPITDRPWLQPYPDRLLDEISSGDAESDAVAVARDTIGLAYIAALQLLAPRQRAAVILRDVLGWSMRETAGLLDTTIVAADSALQRGRSTMQTRLPADRSDGSVAAPNTEERALLARFIHAHERTDATGDWRLVPTAANRQPAAARYLRVSGAVEHRAFELDVLRIECGVIAEITTFDSRLFPAFGLPLTL
jgi:RNA polymerase sigma-70 factor (ECF subfamily)